MAICVMAVAGVAPCQCFSPGGNQITSPGRICSSYDLRAQQRLDRAALIHRAVALCHLVERQGEIEDLARIHLPVPHQVDQLRQETAHRCRTAVEVDVGEEQSLTIELDPMW